MGIKPTTLQIITLNALSLSYEGMCFFSNRQVPTFATRREGFNWGNGLCEASRGLA